MTVVPLVKEEDRLSVGQHKVKTTISGKISMLGRGRGRG
jgi:hypothetical protein